MNVYLSAILSSAVISAIVAGLVSIFQNYRNSSLEYVTRDRQNFRSNMRDIATKLSNITDPKSPELNELLAEIKTRINPYGLAIKSDEKNKDWVKEDGYMWNLIDKIEADFNSETLSVDLDLLIKYISFQVKFDWEQVKKESRISQYTLFSVGFLIATILADIFIDRNFFSIPNKIFIPCSIFLIGLIYGASIVPLIKKTYTKSNELWMLIPILGLLFFYGTTVSNNLTLLSPILLVISIFLNWINYINKELLIKKYESGIKKLANYTILLNQ